MADRAGSGLKGRRAALAVALAGLAASTLLATIAGGSSAAEPGARSVRVATTGNGSELVKTLPITRHKGEEKRVVMSLRPGTLPTLEKGDHLRLTSEMQITVNCAFQSPRCVGPIYGYNPKIRTRLIMAPDAETTSGPQALPVSGYQRDTCTEHKPDREHHCVLVFTQAGLVVRRTDQLPCPLDACYVNLVADVHNRNAGPGDVVLVGGNRPDGTIPQDRSRINAIRYRGATAPDFPSVATHNRLISAIPPDFKRRVVYSKRLNGLRAGEQLAVSASMRTDITHVPYAVRTSSRLILADSPKATKQGSFVKGIADSNGEISENNGFNCTQDKGTCLTQKVGVLEMRKDAVNGRGNSVPLYVNMVTVFGPKVVDARPGDRILLRRGGIRVTRFPPDLNG
jgi:hypothetical protein